MKSSPRPTSPSVRYGRRHASRPRVESLEGRALLSGAPAPAAAYGDLALAFEANRGQAAPEIDFLARGAGYALALTPSEAVLALHRNAGGDVLALQLVGAGPSAQVVGRDELITKTNYLIGSDPARWRTDIPNYGKVEYRAVYPGIDLVYYGSQGELEYDFVVAPGADPGAIRIAIQGAERIALDAGGDLVVHTSGGDVVQHAPVLYQEADDGRRAVAGEFELREDGEVGFRIGAYDPSRPLVIDPILSYATYLGGAGSDQAAAIAVDAAGNAYLAGTTYSADFATTAGASQPAPGGTPDAFVAKLNAAGTALIYSTYLGGVSDDYGFGIAVGAAGDAYVTGGTASNNFPTTAAAFQHVDPAAGPFHGFVARLDAAGSSLTYSTYLGGRDGYDSTGNALAVDSAGNAYVTGWTASASFPTRNALQPAHADDAGFGSSGHRDAFVTELNATGTALVYSTYLGGTSDDRGQGIAVDGAGNAYVAGSTEATHPTDPAAGWIAFPTTAGAFQATNATPAGNSVPFVAKVAAAGAALAYSTFLGGTTGDNDWAAAIAVDSAGDAYVAGSTQAADFPTTPGAPRRTYGGRIDAFVAALNPGGTALVYSTYLGGTGGDQALGVAVDGTGAAYVAGNTSSADFPTANAVQPALGGGNDAFATKINPSGTALDYSTFLGGGGDDGGAGIAVDAAGDVYLAGWTDSASFPTTAGALDPTMGGPEDAFVAKLAPAPLALSIDDSSIVEGNSGTSIVSFTVSLTEASTQAVTVSYATADGTATAGSDYVAGSGTLTFAPGETRKTVSAAIVGDVLKEADETFFVDLSGPTNATLGRSRGTGTIRDDDATKFYVVNDAASGDRTYEYGAAGNALGSTVLNSGDTAPRGAASTAAGSKVWVVDANKTVYVYNASGVLLGSWAAGGLVSNATVEGIATDGTDVWIVDARKDRVYRYAGAAGRVSGSQSAADSFALNSGNASPKDLVTDGASLWVVNDSTTDKVFKYTLAGSLVGSWSITGAGSSPTGITLDPSGGSQLWVVDSGTRRAYQFDNARGLTSGSLAPSTSFALAAGNTNPQGIADPPIARQAPEVAPGLRDTHHHDSGQVRPIRGHAATPSRPWPRCWQTASPPNPRPGRQALQDHRRGAGPFGLRLPG